MLLIAKAMRDNDLTVAELPNSFVDIDDTDVFQDAYDCFYNACQQPSLAEKMAHRASARSWILQKGVYFLMLFNWISPHLCPCIDDFNRDELQDPQRCAELVVEYANACFGSNMFGLRIRPRDILVGDRHSLCHLISLCMFHHAQGVATNYIPKQTVEELELEEIRYQAERAAERAKADAKAAFVHARIAKEDAAEATYDKELWSEYMLNLKWHAQSEADYDSTQEAVVFNDALQMNLFGADSAEEELEADDAADRDKFSLLPFIKVADVLNMLSYVHSNPYRDYIECLRLVRSRFRELRGLYRHYAALSGPSMCVASADFWQMLVDSGISKSSREFTKAACNSMQNRCRLSASGALDHFLSPKEQTMSPSMFGTLKMLRPVLASIPDPAITETHLRNADLISIVGDAITQESLPEMEPWTKSSELRPLEFTEALLRLAGDTRVVKSLDGEEDTKTTDGEPFTLADRLTMLLDNFIMPNGTISTVDKFLKDSNNDSVQSVFALFRKPLHKVYNQYSNKSLQAMRVEDLQALCRDARLLDSNLTVSSVREVVQHLVSIPGVSTTEKDEPTLDWFDFCNAVAVFGSTKVSHPWAPLHKRIRLFFDKILFPALKDKVSVNVSGVKAGPDLRQERMNSVARAIDRRRSQHSQAMANMVSTLQHQLMKQRAASSLQASSHAEPKAEASWSGVPVLIDALQQKADEAERHLQPYRSKVLSPHIVWLLATICTLLLCCLISVFAALCAVASMLCRLASPVLRATWACLGRESWKLSHQVPASLIYLQSQPNHPSDVFCLCDDVILIWLSKLLCSLRKSSVARTPRSRQGSLIENMPSHLSKSQSSIPIVKSEIRCNLVADACLHNRPWLCPYLNAAGNI